VVGVVAVEVSALVQKAAAMEGASRLTPLYLMSMSTAW
jgi:hypothetical protein